MLACQIFVNWNSIFIKPEMLIYDESVRKLETEENKIKWAVQIKHITINENARHQNLTQLTTVVIVTLFNGCHDYMREGLLVVQLM
jgi:hypothetical protein